MHMTQKELRKKIIDLNRTLPREDEEVCPTKWLLKSMQRVEENEARGRVSPTFSNIAEMKKWHDEHTVLENRIRREQRKRAGLEDA